MADLTGLNRPGAVAFYLPQFHPIPENDAAWGTGFTEWRSVVNARPVYRGHRQPAVPADLGFYDLRLSASREAQAALASRFAVDAFCYYHYWFAGRRLLGAPLDGILTSGIPRLPFCLCWANEAWRSNWDGGTGTVLVDQTYSAHDDIEHIRWLLPVFADERYLRIDGKPLYLVYRANLLPEPRRTTDAWRHEASEAGLGELFLCRVESLKDERGDPRPLGFDGSVEFQPDWASLPQRVSGFGANRVYDYRELAERALAKPRPTWRRFRCVTPRWDNTPRRRPGVIFAGSSPERYCAWLASVVNDANPEDLVFVNAWNEWGEGAYLEPDTGSGLAYLQAHASAMVSPQDRVGRMPQLPKRPSRFGRRSKG